MRKKGMRKIFKGLHLVIAGVSLLSVSVMAAGNESGKTDYMHVNEKKIVFCNEEDISLDDFGTIADVEITEMKENVPITEMENILAHSNKNADTVISGMADTLSTYSLSADAYEPNDTPETAYNYDLMPELEGHLFNTGFKSANLHTVEDEDWYYTNLSAGVKYFLDLRNIGSTRGFNISLFYINDDGTIDYLSSIGDEKFEDRPEKYYYVTPNKSGKYYVCITGDGVNVSSMYYFFYIGNSQRTFTYTGSVGGVQILGPSYPTGTVLDLTGVVPKKSIVINMSLSNEFSGMKCSECQKRVVTANGKAYYSSSSGGTDILNISKQEYLDQKWTVSGRCAKGHVTYWTPKMTAMYLCTMQPYPGNEVD